jgi:hypothetical protein
MFTTRLTTPLGVCVLLSMLSAPAIAATVGFELRIRGGQNAPIFHLLNTSTTSAKITHMEITIGDSNYNFNQYEEKTLNTVDLSTFNLQTDGSVRSNVMTADFTDFDNVNAFRVKTDIDIDSVNSTENFKTILFDLGGSDSSDNSLVSIDFSDGTFLSGHLPDYATETENPFIYSLSKNVPGGPVGNPGGNPSSPAIPLPSGLWAGLTLLGGLGVFSFAKKSFRKTL